MKLVTAVLVACVSLGLWTLHLSGAERVKSVKQWNGIIKDEALRKLAPRRGFVANAKAWEKLWKAWRPKQQLPEVDFTKEFVVVATVAGPKQVSVLGGKLNDRGDLNVAVGIAVSPKEAAAPGFGYCLAVFSRKGIKTFGGKPIAQD
jgi:hypothetical protein